MALRPSHHRWSDGQVKVYLGFFRYDPLDTRVRLMQWSTRRGLAEREYTDHYSYPCIDTWLRIKVIAMDYPGVLSEKHHAQHGRDSRHRLPGHPPALSSGHVMVRYKLNLEKGR